MIDERIRMRTDDEPKDVHAYPSQSEHIAHSAWALGQGHTDHLQAPISHQSIDQSLKASPPVLTAAPSTITQTLFTVVVLLLPSPSSQLLKQIALPLKPIPASSSTTERQVPPAQIA